MVSGCEPQKPGVWPCACLWGQLCACQSAVGGRTAGGFKGPKVTVFSGRPHVPLGAPRGPPGMLPLSAPSPSHSDLLGETPASPTTRDGPARPSLHRQRPSRTGRQRTGRPAGRPGRRLSSRHTTPRGRTALWSGNPGSNHKAQISLWLCDLRQSPQGRTAGRQSSSGAPPPAGPVAAPRLTSRISCFSASMSCCITGGDNGFSSSWTGLGAT